MTNTISAAAPSRRAALASLAGLGAAMALPKGAKAATGAVDLVIADLAARYTAAHARRIAAMIAGDEAEIRFVRPAQPAALWARDDEPHPFHACWARFTEDRRWFGDADIIEQLRTFDPDHQVWSYPGAAARRDELVGAWDAWRAAVRAAEDEAGVTQAEAEFVAADRALMAIQEELVRLRSTDPAAVRLKLQVFADTMERPGYLDAAIEKELDGRGDADVALALSIARDLGAFPKASV